MDYRYGILDNYDDELDQNPSPIRSRESIPQRIVSSFHPANAILKRVDYVLVPDTVLSSTR
jgi:hypothetical protein